MHHQDYSTRSSGRGNHRPQQQNYNSNRATAPQQVHQHNRVAPPLNHSSSSSVSEWRNDPSYADQPFSPSSSRFDSSQTQGNLPSPMKPTQRSFPSAVPQVTDHIYRQQNYSHNGTATSSTDYGRRVPSSDSSRSHLPPPPRVSSNSSSKASSSPKRNKAPRSASSEMPYKKVSQFFNKLTGSSSGSNSSEGTHSKQKSSPPPQIDPKPQSYSGLENPRGSNNCFLNVIVQLLYHLPVFRDFFLSISARKHKCTDTAQVSSSNNPNRTCSCVFCALQILFNHFRYGQEDILSPLQLRASLSKAYEASGRYQLFQMDDACEAYQSLLEQLNESMKGSNIRIKCFDFTVEEQSMCPDCGKSGASLQYTTNLWYTNSDEFLKYKRDHPNFSFEQIFRLISESEMKTCDNPECENKNFIPVYKKVVVPPVLCTGVAWDSAENLRKENISDFMSMIPETTTVGNLFRLSDIKECKVQLRGILLYYGKHYQCVIRDDKLGWFMFDDHNVKQVGEFEKVVEKCASGHMLPLLLLWEVTDHPAATLLKNPHEMDRSTVTQKQDPSTREKNSDQQYRPSENIDKTLDPPLSSKRSISTDFGAVVVGSSEGVLDFQIQGTSAVHLFQKIRIPSATKGSTPGSQQVNICIFNQKGNLNNEEWTVFFKMGKEKWREYPQKLNHSSSSILISFPAWMLSSKEYCYVTLKKTEG